MSLITNCLRAVAFGAVLLATMGVSGISAAQQGREHQRHGGGGNQGRYRGRGAQTRYRATVQRRAVRPQASYRTYASVRSTNQGRWSASNRARNNNNQWRAQTLSGGRGHGYTADTWRGGHPDWNGNYYYHNGGYFYDSGFGYPAIMTNEWSSIALLGGGIALAGALSNDPTLFFAGSVGAFYAIGAFNSDRYGDDTARLRYSYFNRPYFWRSGVRFNRVSVVVGGERGYRFQRE